MYHALGEPSRAGKHAVVARRVADLVTWSEFGAPGIGDRVHREAALGGRGYRPWKRSSMKRITS